jgi:hypothetical protein
MPSPRETLLRQVVDELAAIARPSASAGERRAAEAVAARLEALGVPTRLEEERAHGTYWWPLGLLSGAAALAGATALRGGRRARAAAALLGAGAAAGVADDVGGGRLWFRRALLPRRTAVNVVGELGDPAAPRTVLVVAHHDAAHTSLIFHPRALRAVADALPGLYARVSSTPPLMAPVVAGPALVALGALLARPGVLAAGTLVAAASTASFVEIGLGDVVPGANDNASGVAALVGAAAALAARPAPGVRVVLLSTGAEESFMEGMQAFARRHLRDVDPSSTWVLCLDTVGSGELVLLEGEGMLRMREYPAAFKALVEDAAREAGVALRRGLRFRNATDGLIALRAGLPTAMIGSCDAYKLPTEYHWPTDTPERVDFAGVARAAAVVEAVVRRLARSGAAA